MKKVKFTRLYDDYGYVSGYKCGKYYIMKRYTWGNAYEWIINKSGRCHYFEHEFWDEIESGRVILCENLKIAKQKVKEMIENEK